MNRTKILYMTQIAIFIAIEFILSFTPLGYVNVPGLSITFLMVPVALASMLLGPMAGSILGLTFGLTSFAQCFGASAFGAALLSISPLNTFILCVFPRVLAGFLPGLTFKLHAEGLKISELRYSTYITTALFASLLNTVLFTGGLLMFFWNTPYIQELASGMNALSPVLFAVLFVGLNGLIEAIACCFIAGTVAKMLHKVVNHHTNVRTQDVIKIVAEFHVQNGKRDEYLKTARLLEEESQRELGCLYYVIHEDIADENTITMIETWESEEAIERHNNSEHVKEYGPVLQALREPDANIRKYREVEH